MTSNSPVPGDVIFSTRGMWQGVGVILRAQRVGISMKGLPGTLPKRGADGDVYIVKFWEHESARWQFGDSALLPHQFAVVGNLRPALNDEEWEEFLDYANTLY